MPVAAAVAGSVITGAMAADASKSAANTQAEAADRATQAQREAAAQQRADLQPWRATGEQANNKLAGMLGLNGPATDFTTDPSYQFRLAEGQKAVENSGAARGMTLSGAALKALTKYGQGAASTEFQNSYNRLAGVSGMGQSAAAGQGAGAMQFGTQQANNIIDSGNAQASGIVGGANAWGNAISSGVNGYQQNELMKLIRKDPNDYSVVPGSGSSSRNAMYSNAGYGW
jgi:hypothetical protein